MSQSAGEPPSPSAESKEKPLKTPVLRIRDIYPGSWFLPIPDPGSKNSNKREGWKKICCHTFFVATNFSKLNIIFFLIWQRKIWATFQRIIEVFTQIIVTKLSKIWVWDPGSGKSLFHIPDPRSMGQKGTGSRIRIRNTGKRRQNTQDLEFKRKCHFRVGKCEILSISPAFRKLVHVFRENEKN